MIKNRLTWLIGLMLFAAGMIWSQSFPKDFFRVQSIHDLFEIFSSAATVIAVLIAWATMSSWRKQAQAEYDHALARDLVVLLRKYNDELVKTWHYAGSAITHIENSSWIGDGGSDSLFVTVYQARIKEIEAVRAALSPLELEICEVWSESLKIHFLELTSLDELLCSIINTYIRLMVRGTFDERSEFESTNALNSWEAINSLGLDTAVAAQQKIAKAIDKLKSPAKRRLIGYGSV
ncbi:hypothetical protein EC915_113107 [Pseudomonas sp. LP_7_YM]|nr:hypothetical protein EC915_113107 [Pseudomonas sp. LP_7_YM]